MLFPSCQAIKVKWLDELAFCVSFLLLIVISKNELLGPWAFTPVAFQGWQLLFSFVIFICLLTHPRIRNEVKILDKSNLILTLPVSISYAVSVAAGVVGLSVLPVPIFLAWTNISPSLLAFTTRRNKAFTYPRVFGSLLIWLSVIVIFMFHSSESNRPFYLSATIHVVINFIQALYLKKINVQIPDFTLVFYNNLLGFIILFPFSVYKLTNARPLLSSVLACGVTGFFSLAVHIFGFRIKAKHNRILIVQGVAQLITILTSQCMFGAPFSDWLWCLILVNWFTSGFILNLDDDDNKNNQFILVVPQVTKNLYVEKYINYNDMA